MNEAASRALQSPDPSFPSTLFETKRVPPRNVGWSSNAKTLLRFFSAQTMLCTLGLVGPILVDNSCAIWRIAAPSMDGLVGRLSVSPMNHAYAIHLMTIDASDSSPGVNKFLNK